MLFFGDKDEDKTHEDGNLSATLELSSHSCKFADVPVAIILNLNNHRQAFIFAFCLLSCLNFLINYSQAHKLNPADDVVYSFRFASSFYERKQYWCLE